MIAHQHQLDGVLRTLKLSGLLDTLDARLVQARAGDLGRLEFLQALCEDEIARREATAVTRRVRAARFEEPTTLEDFDFKFNPSIPAALIRYPATLRFLTSAVLLHPRAVVATVRGRLFGPDRVAGGEWWHASVGLLPGCYRADRRWCGVERP